MTSCNSIKVDKGEGEWSPKLDKVDEGWEGVGYDPYPFFVDKMPFFLKRDPSCFRELPIKKIPLLPKRSDPPPPRLLELLGHFFVG